MVEQEEQVGWHDWKVRVIDLVGSHERGRVGRLRAPAAPPGFLDQVLVQICYSNGQHRAESTRKKRQHGTTMRPDHKSRRDRLDGPDDACPWSGTVPVVVGTMAFARTGRVPAKSQARPSRDLQVRLPDLGRTNSWTRLLDVDTGTSTSSSPRPSRRLPSVLTPELTYGDPTSASGQSRSPSRQRIVPCLHYSPASSLVRVATLCGPRSDQGTCEPWNGRTARQEASLS